MSEHPSARGRLIRAATVAADRPVTAEQAAACATAPRHADRACCCLAQPVVMVMLPAGGGRQTDTDLLLCGHHYRARKAALVETGATFLDMRGYRLGNQDWPDASGT